MHRHFMIFLSRILFSLLFVYVSPFFTVQTPHSGAPIATFHLLLGNDIILDTYTDHFLEALKRQLSKHGVDTVVYIAGQSSDAEIADADLLIYLQSDQSEAGGKVEPNGWPLHRQLSEQSPLLYQAFQALSWDIAYEQDDQLTTQVMLDFTTGLSLYTLKRCNIADPYFAHLQEILPTLSSNTLNLQANVSFYRGNCALLDGDFATAAHFYETARAFKPRLTLFSDASAVNLAWVYIKLGRADEAFQLMDAEVARFNPKYSLFTVTALEQRSQLHALAFQYDDAISDLNLAIQYCMASTNVTPAYCASYYTLRGQTYLLLYEWDEVLADYNKALELDPTYADAYFYRGVLKYSVLQTGASLYPEALADFQHYLDLVPDGEHAADANRYATDIQTQLAALNN